MNLQEALKLLRTELKLTQDELARALHVSFATVNRWENGRSKPNAAISVALVSFARAKLASSYCVSALSAALKGIKRRDSIPDAELNYAQLCRLVDHIPGGVGIYRVYADDRVEMVYINDGFYRMLDTDRAGRRQFAGFRVLHAIHPGDRPALVRELRAAIDAGRMADSEFRVERNSGDYIWMHMRANIIEHDAEQATIYCSFWDIDAKVAALRKSQANRRAFALLGRSGNILFWRYNLDSRVYLSDDDGDGIGYPEKIEDFPESILGTGTIFSEDDERVRALYQQLRDGACSVEGTVRVLNRLSGAYERRHILLACLDARDGEERVAVGLATPAEPERGVQTASSGKEN